MRGEQMNILLTALFSLSSGLIGVFIGAYCNRKQEIRQEQISLLKSLVVNRFNVCHSDRSAAINMIPIVFFKNTSICQLHEKYISTHKRITEIIKSGGYASNELLELHDIYIKIIEEIAKSLKMDKTITWDKVKYTYIPNSYIENGIQHWY